MNEIKQQIPNMLTSANLVLGCLAIISALDGHLYQAGYFIIAAGVLDFFDGFVARALHAQSEMGKQLDSLADVVSFGVAPGMIFFIFSGTCLGNEGFCITPYISFIIPVFSALRLAKFNLDTRQTNQFIGLPTPANAFLILSIPFASDNYLHDLLQHEFFLKLFPSLSAYLLTSELPLIALKFKNFSVKDNLHAYVLIVVSIARVLLFQISGIGLSIIAYILISMLKHFTEKSATS
jgi:CDP-diacylglycerol--serine O-phosphatidyltransferase